MLTIKHVKLQITKQEKLNLGSGKRPNQKYLPSGCMARIRLNAHPSRGCLRITKFHPYHKGHKQDEEDYLKVIKQRRSKAGKFCILPEICEKLPFKTSL